jgi:hypothetical protein
MKRSELSPPTRAVCQAFVDGLEEILGPNLYGVYLYGATVFPDSGPVQDIDCHVILKKPPSEGEKGDIRALHEGLAKRFPHLGGELDAYFITCQEAQGASPPRHHLHPTMRDESWALHCAHVRAGYYVTLYGPEPTDVFPSPSWPDVAAALDHEMRYVEENLHYTAYCVLNLCRIVYSFQERDVAVSKRFCGNWACERFPRWAALVKAALRVYEGTATPRDEELLHAEVERFLKFATGHIYETRAAR